jgi:hypothetical protein
MKKTIKLFGLFCAITFATVGAIFLLMPEGVLSFFNSFSLVFHLNQAPVVFPGFFLILSVGYMYIVTLIACQIFRNPENPIFLLLLANAKLASSLLSLFLIFRDNLYLIYFANFLVDGLIGAAAIYFYLKIKI